MKIRIAIIEDEFYTRKAIGQYIGKLGTPYEVCGEAGNGQEGLELLRRERPEIALVDITMPIVNGIDMIQIAANEGLPTQMIILTGYSEFSYARSDYKPLYPEVQQLSLGQIDVVNHILDDQVVYSDEQVEQLATKIERMLDIKREPGMDATDLLRTVAHDYQHFALQVI